MRASEGKPQGSVWAVAWPGPLVAFGLALASLFILPNLALVSWYWRVFNLIGSASASGSEPIFAGPTVTAMVSVGIAMVIAAVNVVVFSRMPSFQPRRELALAGVLISTFGAALAVGILAIQVVVQ